jgi:hypothetical protein
MEYPSDKIPVFLFRPAKKGKPGESIPAGLKSVTVGRFF